MTRDHSTEFLVLLDTLFFLCISLGTTVICSGPTVGLLWLVGAPISFYGWLVLVSATSAVLLLRLQLAGAQL